MIFGEWSIRRAVNASGVLHKMAAIYEALQVGARYANRNKITRTQQSCTANEIKQSCGMSRIGFGYGVTFH
jgi:hypothetical protein